MNITDTNWITRKGESFNTMVDITFQTLETEYIRYSQRTFLTSFKSAGTRNVTIPPVTVQMQLLYVAHYVIIRTCGGAVSWGTALQTGRSWFRFPVVSMEFYNPSGATMALGSTQPLTEWVPGIFCRGCVGLTTLPPSCADCLEIWEPQHPGNLRTCPGL